ncbi:hypothetical protein Bca4012_092653 [Brassica carinata]
MCFFFQQSEELTMSPKLGETYEGKIGSRLPIETTQILKENEIYQIQYLSLLQNNQRYKLTTQPYIIQINTSTKIDRIEKEIPMMPLTTFHPLLYKQLINLATATNYLPVRPTYLHSHITHRIKRVRLTLMDNASSLFRDLHCRTYMKYEVVIIASINPRVCKGKLILTSTPATRFYCDSTIDLIQSFNQRNKVSNHP